MWGCMGRCGCGMCGWMGVNIRWAGVVRVGVCGICGYGWVGG